MNGLIHVGEKQTPAGRYNEKPTTGLSEQLKQFNFKIVLGYNISSVLHIKVLGAFFFKVLKIFFIKTGLKLKLTAK